HSQRHQMRVREERKRVRNLADAQLAVLFQGERLQLAVKHNLAERLLVAGASGRHVLLRRVPKLRTGFQPRKRLGCNSPAQIDLNPAGFPSRDACYGVRRGCGLPLGYSAHGGGMKPVVWAIAAALVLGAAGCGPRGAEPLSAFDGRIQDWTRELLADSP